MKHIHIAFGNPSVVAILYKQKSVDVSQLMKLFDNVKDVFCVSPF